jgi:hypothetical protein
LLTSEFLHSGIGKRKENVEVAAPIKRYRVELGSRLKTGARVECGEMWGFYRGYRGNPDRELPILAIQYS